jgi:MbtH protein
MSTNIQDLEPEYVVVVNKEEQYSIWSTLKEIPNGWSSVGVRGSKSDCLAYVKSVWIDMRPRSARLS